MFRAEARVIGSGKARLALIWFVLGVHINEHGNLLLEGRVLFSDGVLGVSFCLVSLDWTGLDWKRVPFVQFSDLGMGCFLLYEPAGFDGLSSAGNVHSI